MLIHNNTIYGNTWPSMGMQPIGGILEQSMPGLDLARAITQANLNSIHMYSGNRFLVVCNGQVTELPEAATIDTATSKAEELAHKHQTEAYILKPVRKVAPKRDVVTTDL